MMVMIIKKVGVNSSWKRTHGSRSYFSSPMSSCLPNVRGKAKERRRFYVERQFEKRCDQVIEGQEKSIETANRYSSLHRYIVNVFLQFGADMKQVLPVVWEVFELIGIDRCENDH